MTRLMLPSTNTVIYAAVAAATAEYCLCVWTVKRHKEERKRTRAAYSSGNGSTSVGPDRASKYRWTTPTTTTSTTDGGEHSVRTKPVAIL